MKFFLMLFLFVFVFIEDGWAPPPSSDYDDVAEERWDEHGKNDDGTWWGVTDGVRYEGVSICSSQYGNQLETENNIDLTTGDHCWCKITSPFDGMYVNVTGYQQGSCSDFCQCGEEEFLNSAGFFFEAEFIMQLHNALLNSQRSSVQPVFYLNLSNGVVLPLYEEKTTSPALHIMYGEKIYYGNIKSGQGTNTINLKDSNGGLWYMEK